MSRSRSVIALALAIQVLALGLWTAGQLGVLKGLIHDALQPGASNYAVSIVIASAFALALAVAGLWSLLLLVQSDVPSLNVMVRLEWGVMGLVVITALATQFALTLPMVMAFVAAIVVVAVALRTRLA